MEAMGAGCAGKPYKPVACKLTEAPSDTTKWPPIPLERALESMTRANGKVPGAYYVGTAWVHPDEKGEVRNRGAQFGALVAIVLDDVGTKANPNTLPPSYIIETSPGNFQWGYLLDRPIEELSVARAFVKAVYGSDKTDQGGGLVTKFVRLPAGVHGKMKDGERSLTPVRLVEFHPDRRYSYAMMLAAWGLTLVGTAEPKLQVKDEVVDWLKKEGHITTTTGDWLSLRCPNAHKHTPGGSDTAAYSPLGQGGDRWENTRGFHCFHAHCKDFNFLAWVKDKGGPEVGKYDPVPVMQARYVLIERGQLVGDLWARPGEEPTPLGDFKAARTFPGRSGKKPPTAGNMWQNSFETTRLKCAVYRPGEPENRIVTRDGIRGFNLFLPPQHIYTKLTPEGFLRHVEHVIPDEEERETLYDWLAFKLQNPALRSYAVLQVAALHEAERESDDQHTYGIGRGMMGAYIKQVWQAGIHEFNLDTLLGRGSQAAFTDWKGRSQLVIIQEAKEARGKNEWSDGTANYEALKTHIDPQVTRGERVAAKYGRIENVDSYYNVLVNSNHPDALRLPADDRRFYIITNNTRRRSSDEYHSVHCILEKKSEAAPLFYWLMNRDVTGFKPAEPAMSPGKRLMIEASASSADEVWDAMMERLPGDVVTKMQLHAASELVNRDAYPGEEIPARMVSARWRGLPTLDPNDPKNGGRVTLADGKRVTARVIRNVRKWRKADKDDARFECKKNNTVVAETNHKDDLL